MLNLESRNLQPELMDSPGLEAGRFVGALKGLGRVNRVTGSAGILWPLVKATSRQKRGSPLRVLDVACGGGDVIISLWQRCRSQGLEVDFHGCDIRPLAVAHATAQAERKETVVTFFQLNAVTDSIPPGYDMIMSSLFLHHLSSEKAEAFLGKAADAAGKRVVIHDLERCRAGYVLAYWGVRVLLCNDVCYQDGPRSVQAAFTIPEVTRIAEAAGLTHCAIQKRFPFRFLLQWSRP